MIYLLVRCNMSINSLDRRDSKSSSPGEESDSDIGVYGRVTVSRDGRIDGESPVQKPEPSFFYGRVQIAPDGTVTRTVTQRRVASASYIDPIVAKVRRVVNQALGL